MRICDWSSDVCSSDLDLGADERVGDDPDHLAAGFERAVGDRAHQPEPAPAVNDANPALRQRAPDVARGFDIDRIGGGRRHAIDGKAFPHWGAFTNSVWVEHNGRASSWERSC